MTSAFATDKYLRHLLNAGITLIFGLTAILLSKDRMLRVFEADLIQGILMVFLLLSVILLIGSWYYTTYRDIENYKNIIDFNLVPKLGFTPFLIVILLAFFLSLLISIIDNPLLFSLVYLVYCVIDAIGNYKIVYVYFKILHKNVSELVKGTAHIETIQKHIMLGEHYTGFANTGRVVLNVFIASLASILSYIPLRINTNIRIYLIYSLLILTITLGELIIWKSRLKRDKLIETYTDTRLEL